MGTGPCKDVYIDMGTEMCVQRYVGPQWTWLYSEHSASHVYRAMWAHSGHSSTVSTVPLMCAEVCGPTVDIALQ